MKKCRYAILFVALLGRTPASDISAQEDPFATALPVATRYAKLWETFSLSDFQLEYDVGKRLEGSRIGARALPEELEVYRRSLREPAPTRQYLAIRWMNWQYVRSRTSECNQFVEELWQHAVNIRNDRAKMVAAQKAVSVIDAARPICRELQAIERAFEMDMFSKILEADNQLSACRKQK